MSRGSVALLLLTSTGYLVIGRHLMMIAAMDWFDDLAKSSLAILFLIDGVRDLMSFALGLSGEYAASARNSVHARKWSGDSDSSGTIGSRRMVPGRSDVHSPDAGGNRANTGPP
jgi:hypothetical protein